MATKRDTTGHELVPLSVAQLNAIDCLVRGLTDAEAAAAVGVSRQTVNVWRNHLPTFQAELNQRRLDVWAGSTDRLRALAAKALGVLEGALAVNPDPAVALKIVQLVGLGDQGGHLGEACIGPTDPEAIIEAAVLRRRGRTDAIEIMLSGGPVAERERREVLAEAAGALKALGAGDAG